MVMSVNIGCSEHPDYGACKLQGTTIFTSLLVQHKEDATEHSDEALSVYHIGILFEETITMTSYKCAQASGQLGDSLRNNLQV